MRKKKEKIYREPPLPDVHHIHTQGQLAIMDIRELWTEHTANTETPLDPQLLFLWFLDGLVMLAQEAGASDELLENHLVSALTDVNSDRWNDVLEEMQK